MVPDCVHGQVSLLWLQVEVRAPQALGRKGHRSIASAQLLPVGAGGQGNQEALACSFLSGYQVSMDVIGREENRELMRVGI